jgi:DNA-binding XRE family transcriptional regulator
LQKGNGEALLPISKFYTPGVLGGHLRRLASKEYELIKQVTEIRKELGLTQSKIAEETGLTQQVVSRMEKLGHSPTLRNFIKYIDAMGLDIKITKKM